jgi:hypothetical protein
MRVCNALTSAEELDLIARRVTNAREVRSWLPRWTVPVSSGGVWLRSLPCCPVPAAQTVGLDHRPVGRVGPGGAPGNAALCPPFRPVSSCVPAAPRSGRSRQCDGPGVKPYSQSGSWPCRCLGTSRWSGRQRFQALKLLAFWVERRVVPPIPHVNITKFEDCNLAGGTSHGQAHG